MDGRLPGRDLNATALYTLYHEKWQDHVKRKCNDTYVDAAIDKLRIHRRDLAAKAGVAVSVPSLLHDNVKIATKSLRATAGNQEQSYVWRLDKISTAPQIESHATLSLNGVLPAPMYETCPPASFNHLLDWHDGDSMDFTPFPDDASFDLDAYLTYMEPSTDTDDSDDDLGDKKRGRRAEMMLRDTADDVQQKYDISVAKMKEVFKLAFVMEDDEYDNIMNAAPFPQERQDISSRLDTANASSLEEWTGSFVQKHYCPVPHCRLPDCAHVSGRTILKEPWKSPESVARTLRRSPSKPCANDCYMQNGELGADELEEWDALRLATLKAAIQSYPEASSCELAIWCHASCRQFELQRSQLPYRDESPPPMRSRGRSARRATKIEVTNKLANAAASAENWTGYPFSVPCNHAGPCDKNSGCGCFDTNKRCEKWCGCKTNCVRKLAGCNCKSCNTSNCPCVQESRECDLSVCHGGRHILGRQHPCCNVLVQDGTHPRVTVKPGTYGWGLFADEPIRLGQYVGEYFGEYMSVEREDLEDPVAKFIERSYGYAATKGWSINSANIGNETRFMNHVTKPNVKARPVIVNGDVRIGFTALAPIRKGEEMFLDYGPHFFPKE
ncbi:SET domain-containing protein [Calocera viscosa TUFC12733]|uniref:SET domain-containing protein n=1 Tax=Calocera viscosa (strain TUFC12733) TaxID=1330018 RepID=A0A167R6D1_CALVF|nr:SET domain-containing protein [Calocera viscosa TUFC12733]